jgi:hypothetical protein
MASLSLAPSYDRLIDYLVEKATPQEILAFSISQEESQRAIELIERQSAGLLTPGEMAELEQMRSVDELVGVLKARALEALRRA